MNKELSLEFDILFDNIMSGKAPGLNDYEKSVFLTKGQEDLLKNYFNPKGNKYFEGKEDSSKRMMDFINIIEVRICTSLDSSTYPVSFRKNSSFYSVPEDMFIPLDYIITNDTKDVRVIPLKEEEINRLFSKPYKKPFKNTAYLFTRTDYNKDSAFEVILRKEDLLDTSLKFKVKYIRYPKPIILRDLTEVASEYGLDFNLSINGHSNYSECELRQATKKEILDRAVLLAKSYYEGNPQDIVQLSQINE